MGKEGTTAKFLEALHYFTAHNSTSACSKLSSCARLRERARASRAEIRLDYHPRAYVGGRRFVRMVPLVAPTRDDNMDDLMVASFIENPVVFEGKSVA